MIQKIIKVNGKIMQEKLKRGWTISRFAERFDVTEEEFLEFLQKNFTPKAYSEMVSRLKKNEKRGNQKHTIDSPEKLSSSIEVPDEASEEDCNSNPLDILKSRLSSLEELLDKKELTHKSLVEQRLSIRKKITSYEEELAELKTRSNLCITKVESLLLDYENVYQQMQSVNTDISVTKKAIDAISTEIKELEKLTVFVYESGDFEITSPCDIDISDSWDSIYKKLRDDENLETLTVKQIKTLAKSLAYAKFFSLHSISYEIIFEDEVVEKFFKNL